VFTTSTGARFTLTRFSCARCAYGASSPHRTGTVSDVQWKRLDVGEIGWAPITDSEASNRRPTLTRYESRLAKRPAHPALARLIGESGI
jgi:hypothetical protein